MLFVNRMKDFEKRIGEIEAHIATLSAEINALVSAYENSEKSASLLDEWINGKEESEE